MSELLLAAPAPVFEVDGQVAAELSRDVVRLEIEDATDGLKRLSLRLRAFGPRPGAAEPGLLHLDGATLDFGKRLAVSLGAAGHARTVFRGRISGIEAAFAEAAEPEVVVFAEDQLMLLRMTRRMRTYERVTDADIARTIAAEHGLAADAAADGPTYEVVQQWNVSDLAFLRERARLVRAEIWVQDDTLHFRTRGERAGTELTLVQGNHLLEAQLRADLAHQRSRVHVSGYDARTRDVIDEDAGEDAIRAEFSGGRTGPEILARAFGERPLHRVHEAPLAAAEARSRARAEMLERSRSFVTAVGTTLGSPDMVVGSRLTLERVGAPFDGPGYYVSSLRHTFDRDEGFRTHFQAERAGLGVGT
jgi:uncharacterized protein